MFNNSQKNVLFFLVFFFGCFSIFDCHKNNSNRQISSISKPIIQIVDQKRAFILSQKSKLSKISLNFQGDKTVLRGKTKVNRREIKNIAKHIISLSKVLSEKYSMGDALMMVMYVFKYFAEIGEYDLVQKDLKVIIDNFERLSGSELDDPDILSLIEQVKFIRFGKKDGGLFAQFFTNNPYNGAVLNINQTLDDEDKISMITKLVISNGATIHFRKYNNHRSEIESQKIYLKKKKTPGIYKVNDDILNNYKNYFDNKHYPANPMSLDFDNIALYVSTNTFLKNVKLNLKHGLCLPGMKTSKGKPIPSIIIDANGSIKDLFAGVKASIDL